MLLLVSLPPSLTWKAPWNLAATVFLLTWRGYAGPKSATIAMSLHLMAVGGTSQESCPTRLPKRAPHRMLAENGMRRIEEVRIDRESIRILSFLVAKLIIFCNFAGGKMILFEK